MKFASNTLMEVATWRDVELAVSQGSTTTIRNPKFVTDRFYHTPGKVTSFGNGVRSKGEGVRSLRGRSPGLSYQRYLGVGSEDPSSSSDTQSTVPSSPNLT